MSMPAIAAQSPLKATGRRRIVDLDVEAARVFFMTGN
jgi:hypothetical protein